MSFQAMAWACGTRETPMIWGGPSARSAIYAIANHANDNWFCWAKQDTLATESEQSPDSIQRRLQEFIGLGMIRRIKLKRFGRRTHDFLILKPSPYFAAPIEEIEPFLPRGCDIMAEESMAADCGSVESQEDAATQEDSKINAAAGCGSVLDPTLPQPAVDAAALVRQPNEPFLEPSALTQTLPQPAEGKRPAGEEAAATSDPDLTGLDEFKSTYEEPCSNPELLADVWAKMTADTRERCLRGARGVRAYRRKNPKARGLVGPLRFARSPAVQDEFEKFAPVEAKPLPRVFIAGCSEGFRAWCVLAAILDGPPPEIKPIADKGLGIERLTEFPEPGGRALAEFAQPDGSVDTGRWSIAEDKPEIGNAASFHAWSDRIKAWLGRRPEAYRIGLGYMKKFEWPIGVFKDVEARTTGLRVPRPFPPHIDGSWPVNLSKTG